MKTTDVEYGDWTLPPNALPKRLCEVLNEFVELFDHVYGAVQPWDQEAILEYILLEFKRQLLQEVIQPPLSIEQMHEALEWELPESA